MHKPLTDNEIKNLVSKVDYTLPWAYVELMKIQNGGYPQNNLIQLDEKKQTNYSISEFIKLDAIAEESKYMRNEWAYPDIGLYICHCPSAGHHMVALDYRECGPKGKPMVVHVDQENDFKVTILATNFEQFISKLQYEEQ